MLLSFLSFVSDFSPEAQKLCRTMTNKKDGKRPKYNGELTAFELPLLSCEQSCKKKKRYTKHCSGSSCALKEIMCPSNLQLNVPCIEYERENIPPF